MGLGVDADERRTRTPRSIASRPPRRAGCTRATCRAFPRRPCCAPLAGGRLRRARGGRRDQRVGRLGGPVHRDDRDEESIGECSSPSYEERARQDRQQDRLVLRAHHQPGRTRPRSCATSRASRPCRPTRSRSRSPRSSACLRTMGTLQPG
ncbi:hypothetical protein BC834DRAFT_891488 [Gloeopeniophorella convolvens]|nr:hypothetical protein BC834DRAFT_891488 [Gloeopeniophorella convolvens]